MVRSAERRLKLKFGGGELFIYFILFYNLLPETDIIWEKGS